MTDALADSGPYVGLFATAFLAATILPAQSELLFGAMLLTGRYDTALLLVSATAGNTLGSVANWAMGRFIEHFRHRSWFPVKADDLERAERWYAKWGKWSLLLSWAPVVGDALTLAAGLLRTRLTTFLPLVLVAKGGRYLAVAAALGALSR